MEEGPLVNKNCKTVKMRNGHLIISHNPEASGNDGSKYGSSATVTTCSGDVTRAAMQMMRGRVVHVLGGGMKIVDDRIVRTVIRGRRTFADVGLERVVVTGRGKGKTRTEVRKR